MTLAGLGVVIFSATPIWAWLFALWLSVIIVWLSTGLTKKYVNDKAKIYLRFVVIILSITVALVELRYHLKPQIPGSQYPTLHIIGDSISAGIGGNQERTWPILLEESVDAEIINLAVAGATVKTALRQAEKIEYEFTMVLLEIGGNDLLNQTEPEQFSRQMDELLLKAQGPRRLLVMLELPLPPFCGDYGRIQRTLADKYDVILIPKRYLANVLTTTGATEDGIHLSHKGHQMMAEIMRMLMFSKD